MALYVVGSLIFIGLYVYVYQRHLSSYQMTQQAELKAVHRELTL